MTGPKIRFCLYCHLYLRSTKGKGNSPMLFMHRRIALFGVVISLIGIATPSASQALLSGDHGNFVACAQRSASCNMDSLTEEQRQALEAWADRRQRDQVVRTFSSSRPHSQPPVRIQSNTSVQPVVQQRNAREEAAGRRATERQHNAVIQQQQRLEESRRRQNALNQRNTTSSANNGGCGPNETFVQAHQRRDGVTVRAHCRRRR